jgi:hypothetical protein
MAENGKIVNVSLLQVSNYEGFMTQSLERMARLLFGISASQSASRKRIPRLDISALNARDLADLNLPADVRNRVTGLYETCRSGQRA